MEEIVEIASEEVGGLRVASLVLGSRRCIVRGKSRLKAVKSRRRSRASIMNHYGRQ